MLWKFTVPKGAFEATAVIVDGVVYVGDLDGALLRHRPGHGQGEVEVQDGDRLQRGRRRSRRRGLRRRHRWPVSIAWTPPTASRAGRSRREAEIDAGPNFYKDNVLFGSQDATLYCLNADKGELVWKYTIEDQIRCSPTVVENRCFVAGCDGKLHIIDLDKGKAVGQRADRQRPPAARPPCSATCVYFGTRGRQLLRHRTGGRPQGRLDLQAATKPLPIRSSAAATPDVVIVGSRDKHVHGARSQDGRRSCGPSPRAAAVDSSPVIVGQAGVHRLGRRPAVRAWT